MFFFKQKTAYELRISDWSSDVCSSYLNPDYGALTALTNQYAAMPSLHFGWSLWCGVVIVVLAPKLWMKLLGLLHPLFTICAIVATANHWVLDAVGGAIGRASCRARGWQYV